MALNYLWIVLALGATACKSDDKEDTLDPVGVTSSQDIEIIEKVHGPRISFVLKMNQHLVAPPILPQKTVIDVIWTFEDGYVQSFPGFLGWDFDRDGRFEMVEVFGPKNTIKNKVFDFDGDGKIDQVVDDGKNSSKKLTP